MFHTILSLVLNVQISKFCFWKEITFLIWLWVAAMQYFQLCRTLTFSYCRAFSSPHTKSLFTTFAIQQEVGWPDRRDLLPLNTGERITTSSMGNWNVRFNSLSFHFSILFKDYCHDKPPHYCVFLWKISDCRHLKASFHSLGLEILFLFLEYSFAKDNLS